MKKSRRGFVKASTAMGVLEITEVSAQSELHAPRPSVSGHSKTIGFVVSTGIQPNHVFSFLQALEDNGWGKTAAAPNTVKLLWESANGRYGASHDELQNLTKKHIRINKVDMIVAAGGLMTAIAVAKALGSVAAPTFPFVYLIGRSPLAGESDAAEFFSSPNKAGGVDQAIPDQNENNFQQIRNASNNVVMADTVGLVVNSNNAMSGPEVGLWLSKGHKQDFVYSATAENEQQLSTIFAKIKNTNPQPAGLVVSSDPYFRSVGPEFDTQLRAVTGGNFSGWVCYPYWEYLDQDPPASKRSVLSSNTPFLAIDDPTKKTMAAYYQLGMKAAAVLTYLANWDPTQPLKPDVGITSWNGSKWV